MHLLELELKLMHESFYFQPNCVSRHQGDVRLQVAPCIKVCI